MNYRVSVQCTDKLTGKTGTFLSDDTKLRISPIFESLAGLFPWMHQNGYKMDEYPRNKDGKQVFTPWRAVAVQS